MKTALSISALTGIAWAAVAVVLMGGRFEDVARLSFLLAGAAAGVAAGLHTIRTRRGKDGAEGWLAGIACYYFAIVVFWAVCFIVERVTMCVEAGAWTDFDLRDHLTMLPIFLLYGTLPYGLALVPVCFLNRWLVWRATQWVSS